MPDITLTEDQVQAVLNAAGSRSPSVARALGLVTTIEPEPVERQPTAETAYGTYGVSAEVADPTEVPDPTVEFDPGLAGPDAEVAPLSPVIEDDGA